jgi:hypothetical protein
MQPQGGFQVFFNEIKGLDDTLQQNLVGKIVEN